MCSWVQNPRTTPSPAPSVPYTQQMERFLDQPIPCKSCGKKLRIWFDDDGNANPHFEAECPNCGKPLALDLRGASRRAGVAARSAPWGRPACPTSSTHPRSGINQGEAEWN